MASEPAEPTTRQDGLDVASRAAFILAAKEWRRYMRLDSAEIANATIARNTAIAERDAAERERDALSLLLRGMARKVVAARAERVALERILSKERRRVDAALALHTEFKIYDECGHEHTDEDVDAGRAFEVSDVGYVCAEGYEYSICRRCCTDDTGFQGEACANHERPCWPCPTRAALVGDQPPAAGDAP